MAPEDSNFWYVTLPVPIHLKVSKAVWLVFAQQTHLPIDLFPYTWKTFS